MFTRKRGAKLAAVAASAALVLAACGDDEDPDAGDDPPEEEEDDDGEEDEEEPADEAIDREVTIGYPQELTTYNNQTGLNNALANTVVNERLLRGFVYEDDNGALVHNPDIGSLELVSEDPLTVTYTFHPDAAWSDGEPLDCDDAYLIWAAQGGRLGFSTAGTTQYNDSTMGAPQCEAGDKEFTVEYEQVYIDWEQAFGSFRPAHIVAQEGGFASGAELLDALKAEDEDGLADAVAFYNEGWIMEPGNLLPEEMVPSIGQYKYDTWEAGEFLTLTANEAYWGEPPLSSTITIRQVPSEQVAQALQNREIDLAEPQPEANVVDQLNGVDGLTVSGANQFTREHLDFNMEGPFGEDLRLRQAFAHCVPRQQIVDNLIAPVQPGAVVSNLREVMTFQPEYEDVAAVSEEEWSKYVEPDIDAAAALLEEADAVGMEVRIGHIVPNQRRTQTTELIKASCDQAGFNIIDQGEDNFFDADGGLNENTYDVALFAWAGSSAIGTAFAQYTSDGEFECTPEGKGNNVGCYENDEINELKDQFITQPTYADGYPILAEGELILWQDLATIPLFTFPGVAAWDENLEGVSSAPGQERLFWSAHEWVWTAE